MNAYLKKKIEKIVKEEQEIIRKYTIPTPNLKETRVLSTGTITLQVPDNISTIINELTGQYNPELTRINESIPSFTDIYNYPWTNIGYDD